MWHAGRHRCVATGSPPPVRPHYPFHRSAKTAEADPTPSLCCRWSPGRWTAAGRCPPPGVQHRSRGSSPDHLRGERGELRGVQLREILLEQTAATRNLSVPRSSQSIPACAPWGAVGPRAVTTRGQGLAAHPLISSSSSSSSSSGSSAGASEVGLSSRGSPCTAATVSSPPRQLAPPAQHPTGRSILAKTNFATAKARRRPHQQASTGT